MESVREGGVRTMAAPGSRSEGFSTKVLPHTVARGNIHRGIMAGKLKGQMPATTPRGCNRHTKHTKHAVWAQSAEKYSQDIEKAQ